MDINKDNVRPLHETKFLSLYDLEYAEGRHYFIASRNKSEDLVCRKDAETIKKDAASAVTIAAILNVAGEESKLILSYEYRYPVGQFLLSPPAGLIDPEDGTGASALITSTKREIGEELGITIEDSDTVSILNPCLYSTPGMTDESNALMLVELFRDTIPTFSQDNAVGSELFDGYVLLTKEDAKRILTQGCDDKGIYYSVYTWAVMQYFVNR